ncbi:MAG: ABC transporter substrate-binding protein, partial [Candidatus Latescibacteria bacterium]|nr:ABC transporter substrate-binding protein [Candidatus Latescibacterota bacterium]
MKYGFTFALLAVCVLGCLSSDDATMYQQELPETVQKSRRRKSRAPKQIEPQILTARVFGEAPMLAKRVGAGSLPPVSERLPKNPLVVVPVDTIGHYGGTLRRALTGDIVQTAGANKTLAENLMGYERPLPNSIQFNLAESYAFQDGGRVGVFKIRKGIRWSDGHPFTVDDILFWYYDMQMNDDARDSPLPQSVWLVDGKPIQMEKV